MNLVVLAMHQHRIAVATDKIDGVIACVENRRDFKDTADERRGNEFKTETRMRSHRFSPVMQAGALSDSQSPACLTQCPAPMISHHQTMLDRKLSEIAHNQKTADRGPSAVQSGIGRHIGGMGAASDNDEQLGTLANRSAKSKGTGTRAANATAPTILTSSDGQP
jgi:hypothetical protein